MGFLLFRRTGGLCRGSHRSAGIRVGASIRRMIACMKPFLRSHLIWLGMQRKTGTRNEQDNRMCCSRPGADVFGGEGRGTRRRRCAGRLVWCRGAWADRGRGWRGDRLLGRTVDCAFLGLETIEHQPAGTQSREPGHSGACRRQSTSAQQSTCSQSICAQRWSRSSSGRPNTAVGYDHHGFHGAASAATGVSR